MHLPGNMKNIEKNSKSIIWLIWAGIFGVGFLSYFLHNANHLSVQWHYFFYSISVTAAIWLGCQEIVKFLWRRFPWEEYPVKHLVTEVFVIGIYALTVLVLAHGISTFIFNNNALDSGKVGMSLAFSLVITYLITSFYEGYFFYKLWRKSALESEKYMKEQIIAQYHTLKNQVNPHFLFNNLNTLMVYVEENSTAKHFVENLSEFLRYGLTLQEKEIIPLSEEMNMLKKYIFLQKSRFGDSLVVDLEVPDNEVSEIYLPPFSLQMLIENAIKHNVILQSKPLRIKVFLDKTQMVISNNLQRKKTENSTQTGLKNIRNRYKLLTDRDIEVQQSREDFIVRLPLIKVKFDERNNY